MKNYMCLMLFLALCSGCSFQKTNQPIPDKSTVVSCIDQDNNLKIVTVNHDGEEFVIAIHARGLAMVQKPKK